PLGRASYWIAPEGRRTAAPGASCAKVPTPRGNELSRPPTGLLVLVALVGAAAGYYSFRLVGSASRSGAAAPAVRAPTLAAAPAWPGTEPPGDEQAPPAMPVPSEVPDVTIPDMAGKPHQLRDANGHERLFNFWATWCEPCRREIPLLNGLQQQYSAEGLEV